ncbi:MAG: S9 family peptidase, partial [Puniceicoccaceae bacterium]
DLDERTPRLLTRERDVDIRTISWLSDTRLAYRMDSERDREVPRFAGGLYAVNIDGSNFRTIVRPFGGSGRGRDVAFRYTEVIHRLPDDADHVLVLNNSHAAQFPDVYRMNINNGRLRLDFRNPGKIRGWIPDQNGVVRLGFGLEEDGSNYLIYRETANSSWKTISESADDVRNFEPWGFYHDNRRIVVAARLGGRDTRALYLLDPEKLELEEFLADEDFDIEGGFGFSRGIYSPADGRFLGVIYQRDKPTYVWFDEEREALQRDVDLVLPDRFNILTGGDRSGRRVIIRSFSDVQHPEFFLLHLERMEIEKLADPRPWLDASAFVPMEPIRFEASDGMTIPGYLTRPRNAGDGPVPMVAYVHGGPWFRDTWGWDPWTQFFADRGFAVLQINFRGSTGYGARHLTSSFRNVEAMNQDVTDGVRWAIEQGIADPERIGIIGASWGGYATMVGLTQTPELYQFGINIFGVVDLVEHINTYRGRWNRRFAYEYWRTRIGDPTDREQRARLEAASPIQFIDRIRAPVLIYHGEQDINVDIGQSRRLVSALRRQNKEFSWIQVSNEAHSIDSEENRLRLFNEIDRFIQPWTN